MERSEISVIRLYPQPQAEVPLGDLYADLRDLEGPRDPSETAPNGVPYTITNSVGSIDGRASVGGRSGGIGGRVDRGVMRVLRSRADAVMIGAASLRAEKVSLSAADEYLEAADRQPLAVIVTGSARVDLRNLVAHPNQGILIVGPRIRETTGAGHIGQGLLTVEALPQLERRAAEDRRAEAALDPGPLLRRLVREHGVQLLVSEGGPTLNHALLTQAHVSEIFLTLAPKVLAGDTPDSSTLLTGPTIDPTLTNWTLRSIHLPNPQDPAPTSQQDLLLRYARQQQPAGSAIPPTDP